MLARIPHQTPTATIDALRPTPFSRLGVLLLAIACVVAVTSARPAEAYIGPGAGFVVLGSFFVILATMVLAVVSVLLWPFRTLMRVIRRRKRVKPRIKRLVFLGFDGQDPRITEKLMAEGRLPNLSRLKEQGCYHRLRSTFPSITPVAWSTFTTGTNPGRHNIFDFLDRDPRTYLPRLSSTEIGQVDRSLKLGSIRIPLARPHIRLLRKSKPLWTLLGEHNIWSTVLRVPITFPPDRFYGAQLGAMCIPDLLGTQGTFLLFSTRPATTAFQEGGLRFDLLRSNGSKDRFEATVLGPENPFRDGNPAMEIPLALEVDRDRQRGIIKLDGTAIELATGELSGWVRLQFPALATIKVNGICRMMITEMDEHVSLYVSPINIEPDKPAMPISHPTFYATYLERKIGSYATLGLAEDTWALNEKVTNDATFIRQTMDIDGEREAMLGVALDRLRAGMLVTVFDASDRINHMFWRYTEDDHPAAREQGPESPHRNAIEELYIHNDGIVGRVMDRLGDQDVLVVLSDHGCTSFQRGVNLNAWLLKEGYLALKEGCDGTEQWLNAVDWSKTKAYAVGLVGLFVNLQGRERHGIVKPGVDARVLKLELTTKLNGLIDTELGHTAINEVFDTDELYRGPYKGNAPDLLIGYNHGYRISWDCASGVVAGAVFEDNTKAWSGDHIVDPRIVPGIFLCNRAIDVSDPAIVDLAPTALHLFGITPPAYMDGKSLFEESSVREGGTGP